MQRDKIEAALTAALRHMEALIGALPSKDEKTILDSLWSASSETEYAVFLLSLLQRGMSNATSQKQESTVKLPVELESTLSSAQQLLTNAKANLQAGNYVRSYEDAWTARNLLLRAQDHVDKKRRDAGRK